MRRGGRGVSLHFVQFHYTTGDPGRSVRSRHSDEWEYVVVSTHFVRGAIKRNHFINAKLKKIWHNQITKLIN